MSNMFAHAKKCDTMFEPSERKVSRMDIQQEHARSAELRAAQAEIDTAYAKRLALIIKSREQGMSNRSIGWALGITEAAVRAIVRRAHGEDTITSPAWGKLSDGAKDLFLTITTAGKMNMAGVVDWHPKYIPALDLDRGMLALYMAELEDAGLIVVDAEIEEIFVPSHVQYTVKAVADYWPGPSAKIVVAFADALERKRAESPGLPIWKHERIDQIIDAANKWKARA